MQLDQQSPWFKYLDVFQQNLVKTSFYLSDYFTKEKDINDFSFIVFPMAKAYEGFLKKILLDLQLITHKVYYGRRFRIGRALNPDVKVSQRDKWWLYDDLCRIFNDELARDIWQAWLQCRNHVFHFFPHGEKELNLEEAIACLRKMQLVMSAAVELITERNESNKTIES
jgi:hypothetical protein